MDTDNFIVHVKTEDIFEDVTKEVQNWFDTSNCELNTLLPKGKTKKSHWFNKWWIRWKNHERICWVKSKKL